MSPEETAWLAGLFDGEGCVLVDVKIGTRSPGARITITNTNRPLIDRVREVTGVGYISTRYRKSEKHRPTHDWNTTGTNARFLLERMLPWLIVKQERALQAMAGQQREEQSESSITNSTSR